MQLRYFKGVLLIAMIFASSSAFAQNEAKNKVKKYSSGFENKTIPDGQLSILFSYYSQDGNSSAVTGGIGSEKLSDISSKIIVVLPQDENQTITIDAGFDLYSSASTDNIDEFVSSASRKDKRVHANIGYSKKLRNNFLYGFKVGGSTEYDYQSLQFSAYVSKISDNGNRTFGLSAQAFIDKWEVIYPQELRAQAPWVTTDQRRSYSVSASFLQVINKRMQASITADLVTQSGLLSTPFHRVYFTDQVAARVEKLPFNRLKIPVGVRFNYYVTDRILLRSYYRFYWDDWGITGHSASIELPYKINRFFSVYPYYRFHTQSASTFYKPYGEHSTALTYYTSDPDLAKLTSQDIGLGLRYSPVEGIGAFRLPGKKHNIMTLKELSVRFGHYKRNPELTANIVSFGLNFTF
jgi:Protein of unknown function (DUF3570)